MPISADFPFERKYATVLDDSKMCYVDVGPTREPPTASSESPDIFVFVHGNPTTSYIWRNIIPYMSENYRCIAMDLIGMGHSDKPKELEYRFDDHYRYFVSFMQALQLDKVDTKKKVIFVTQDWGSALGIRYTKDYPTVVKGFCMMEGLVRPLKTDDAPLGPMLHLIRMPYVAELMVGRLNLLMKKVMPKKMVVRALTEQEMEHYLAPYPDYESRKAVWTWPREIPFDGQPADNHETLQACWDYMVQSQDLPKLLLSATPGALLSADMVEDFQKQLPNLAHVEVGPGHHNIQEDCPDAIGQALQKWAADLK